MFYRHANAAILVYDVTSYSSFEGMQVWVAELKRHVYEPMVMVVVGNKIDLESRRQVHTQRPPQKSPTGNSPSVFFQVSGDEAVQYAKKISAQYYETSAKEDMVSLPVISVIILTIY